MRLLLDCLYALGLLLASPWLVYTSFRQRGWPAVPARFGLGIEPSAPGAIWLHGSSVGEVSLLAPLIARLERDFPRSPIVISSFTNTGIAAARTRYRQHRVIPLPFDFSFIVRRVLRSIRPAVLVIVESDFWPNLLAAAASASVPVAIVNAKMSERSFRLHRRWRVVPRLLRRSAVVAAQTHEHAARFASLGVPAERITVTGNMKYDLTEDARDDAVRARIRAALGIGAGQTTIIGASLHLPEDEALFDSFVALRRRFPAAALIVVPRYPADGRTVVEHARARGLDAVLKTERDRGHAAGAVADAVLVADTLGELGTLYQAADIAFVGGSLFYRGANKGGHNLMEPAILGIPVLFGPYNFSFKETVADLLAAEAGVMVGDAAALEAALGRFLERPELRAEYGNRARRIVLDGQGATARSLALIAPYIARATVAGQGATDDNAPVRNGPGLR